MSGIRILLSVCLLLTLSCSSSTQNEPGDTSEPILDEGVVTDTGAAIDEGTVADEGTAEPDAQEAEDLGGATAELPEVIDEGPVAPEPKTYTMITVNAGLAYGYVPYSEQRRDQVIAALSELDADVLCIQEVWNEPDYTEVEQTLTSKGYTVHVYVTDGNTSQGCTEEEAQPLVDCSNENNCTELPGSEFTDCVLANCGAAIGQVSQGCLGCLANDLTRSLAEMQENCIGVEEVNSWAYGGHNGLIMALKDPDTEFEGSDFEASLNWRSSIKATAPSMKNTIPAIDSVICTHLTSYLSNVPYNGPFAGYTEENAQQVDGLIATSPEGNHIIMGDLNVGPENTDAGISAELPENFAKFIEANWVAVNTSECTWCPPENNLLNDTSAMHNIDHILLNESLAAQVSTTNTIIWKDSITITDDENQEVEVHLSDHFGLRTELAPNGE